MAGWRWLMLVVVWILMGLNLPAVLAAAGRPTSFLLGKDEAGWAPVPTRPPLNEGLVAAVQTLTEQVALLNARQSRDRSRLRELERRERDARTAMNVMRGDIRQVRQRASRVDAKLDDLDLDLDLDLKLLLLPPPPLQQQSRQREEKKEKENAAGWRIIRPRGEELEGHGSQRSLELSKMARTEETGSDAPTSSAQSPTFSSSFSSSPSPLSFSPSSFRSQLREIEKTLREIRGSRQRRKAGDSEPAEIAESTSALKTKSKTKREGERYDPVSSSVSSSSSTTSSSPSRRKRSPAAGTGRESSAAGVLQDGRSSGTVPLLHEQTVDDARNISLAKPNVTMHDGRDASENEEEIGSDAWYEADRSDRELETGQAGNDARNETGPVEGYESNKPERVDNNNNNNEHNRTGRAESNERDRNGHAGNNESDKPEHVDNNNNNNERNTTGRVDSNERNRNGHAESDERDTNGLVGSDERSNESGQTGKGRKSERERGVRTDSTGVENETAASDKRGETRFLGSDTHNETKPVGNDTVPESRLFGNDTHAGTGQDGSDANFEAGSRERSTSTVYVAGSSRFGTTPRDERVTSHDGIVTVVVVDDDEEEANDDVTSDDVEGSGGGDEFFDIEETNVDANGEEEAGKKRDQEEEDEIGFHGNNNKKKKNQGDVSTDRARDWRTSTAETTSTTSTGPTATPTPLPTNTISTLTRASVTTPTSSSSALPSSSAPASGAATNTTTTTTAAINNDTNNNATDIAAASHTITTTTTTNDSNNNATDIAASSSTITTTTTNDSNNNATDIAAASSTITTTTTTNDNNNATADIAAASSTTTAAATSPATISLDLPACASHAADLARLQRRVERLESRLNATLTAPQAEAVENAARDAVNETVRSHAESEAAEREEALERVQGRVAELGSTVSRLAVRVASLRLKEFVDRVHSSLVNFTANVLTLDQWRVASEQMMNATREAYSTISELGRRVTNNAEVTSELRITLRDYRALSGRQYRLLQAHIIRLNNSLQDLQERGGHHHAARQPPNRGRNRHRGGAAATTSKPGVMDDDDGVVLVSRVEDLALQLVYSDNRLSHLETQFLNKSLAACAKTNNDLYQDASLLRVTQHVADLQRDVMLLQDTTKRLDLGLYRLHGDVKANQQAARSLQGQVKDATEVKAGVEALRKDVDNLLLQLPVDCQDYYDRGYRSSGDYVINPRTSPHAIRVRCVMRTNNNNNKHHGAGGSVSKTLASSDSSDSDNGRRTSNRNDDLADGGWTVIQQRYSGKVNFTRGWAEYAVGFGSSSSEYWLGNEHLHYLTSLRNYSLAISMTDIFGGRWRATYRRFTVSSKDDNYRLALSGYYGNATDSLTYSAGATFSTWDRDNDLSSTPCALYNGGGWWYSHCHVSNLNGPFRLGVIWFHTGLHDWLQLKRVVMAIKPHRSALRRRGRGGRRVGDGGGGSRRRRRDVVSVLGDDDDDDPTLEMFL